MARVQINMTGPSTGEVLVDGVKLDAVVAVRFDVDVRPGSETPSCVEITQRLFPSDVAITGEIDATTLDHASRHFTKGNG